MFYRFRNQAVRLIPRTRPAVQVRHEVGGLALHTLAQQIGNTRSAAANLVTHRLQATLPPARATPCSTIPAASIVKLPPKKSAE